MCVFFFINRRQIRSNRIRIETRVPELEGQIKMEEISNSRMMVIYGDMCQIQHSMKILAKSCLLFQWDMSRQEELSLTFLTYQIQVLVSVLLKNTSNTLLTYCYLWKPQRWKNKIIALFYHNCFLQWWIHISLYIVQLLVIYLELNFHQEIQIFKFKLYHNHD